MTVKRYLNYGGGVNSTAMLVLLTDEGLDFEAVFVDTGAENPETIKYVNYMIEQGYDITVLKPKFPDGSDNLIDYLNKFGIIPLPKWCRYFAKVKTLQEYASKPCEMYIGLHYGERHRIEQVKMHSDPQINYRFPLIERKINQERCIKILKEKGLKIPVKSGCVVCVNSNPEEIIKYMNESRVNTEKLYSYMLTLSESLLKVGRRTEI